MTIAFPGIEAYRRFLPTFSANTFSERVSMMKIDPIAPDEAFDGRRIAVSDCPVSFLERSVAEVDLFL